LSAPTSSHPTASAAASGHGHGPAKPLAAFQSAGLTGQLKPPGDKSISHRALIFGLLSLGETRIEGLLEGDDVLRTAQACRQLGAQVERVGVGSWRVVGAGLGSLLEPVEPLDFGNAGTGTRLMMGVVAGHGITATFDGDASLRKRPMRRILDPLTLMGAQVIAQADGGRCPVVLKGTASPHPIRYISPVPSAQLKSAILLAGLNAAGTLLLTEREATRDHTEKMLAYFGADIQTMGGLDDSRTIFLRGRPHLTPRPVIVPADPSSAAFPLVAALIVPHSEVVIEGVMMNPLRCGLVTTLLEMGAQIDIRNPRMEGGEDVADLHVRASALRGVDVPAHRAPSMIDEYPILAVAAAFAQGETRLRGLSELRVKESDRLAAIADGLKTVGASCWIDGDDLIIHGTAGTVRGGGPVATHLDHRIAMSFLVMGLASTEPVIIDDEGMIATSFPTFASSLSALGARFGAP
jgi:3-phosphoshikimate 1-carboxyvinyltransferase